MMRSRIWPLLLALSASGCAGHAQLVLSPTQDLKGPKEISVMGSHGEVERMLEDQLRERGFRIKAFASTGRVTRSESSGGSVSYNQASTRYVINTDWRIQIQCPGGGFKFDYLRVDVVDTQVNEIVLSTKAKGYSEECRLVSGSIFGDIAQMIDEAWSK